MEAMKKEIARLNTIIASGCMSKEKKQEKVQYKQGKMPGNKYGLGHIKGGKTGQRDIIKGQVCIRF
jgi:hypothetical protein